jgi:hypothetical protein
MAFAGCPRRASASSGGRVGTSHASARMSSPWAALRVAGVRLSLQDACSVGTVDAVSRHFNPGMAPPAFATRLASGADAPARKRHIPHRARVVGRSRSAGLPAPARKPVRQGFELERRRRVGGGTSEFAKGPARGSGAWPEASPAADIIGLCGWARVSFFGSCLVARPPARRLRRNPPQGGSSKETT